MGGGGDGGWVESEFNDRLCLTFSLALAKPNNCYFVLLNILLYLKTYGVGKTIYLFYSLIPAATLAQPQGSEHTWLGPVPGFLNTEKVRHFSALKYTLTFWELLYCSEVALMLSSMEVLTIWNIASAALCSFLGNIGKHCLMYIGGTTYFLRSLNIVIKYVFICNHFL